MTPKEKQIIEGLLNRDDRITKSFFFNTCSRMFYGIIHNFFRDNAVYADLINDFYEFLMEDNAKRLRKFGTRKTESEQNPGEAYALIMWMRTTARRYFKDKAQAAKAKATADLCYEDGEENDSILIDNSNCDPGAVMDAHFYLGKLENEKERMVIEELYLNNVPYKELAKETGLTEANLRKINERALKKLSRIARHALSDDAGCAVRCEHFIMERLGIRKGLEELADIARERGWLADTGTSLADMGSLCEHLGLTVRRSYLSIEGLRECLRSGHHVIAAVDGGELSVNRAEEVAEDLMAEVSDHCVVVLSVSDTAVTVCNPYTEESFKDVPLDIFLDAWEDSGFYAVVV